MATADYHALVAAFHAYRRGWIDGGGWKGIREHSNDDYARGWRDGNTASIRAMQRERRRLSLPLAMPLHPAGGGTT